MKVKFLISPIVALIFVAIWMGRERSSISVLEKETAVAKGRLASRSSSSGPDVVVSKSKSADWLTKENGPINWKKMAAQVAEVYEANDEQSYLRLAKEASALSREELTSELDEIATLDASDKSRQYLQRLLLQSLCEKDPEYALTRYFSLMNYENGFMDLQLEIAMVGWVGKNPAAVIAWLDQQIAAGKFESKSLDGKSPTRMRFEGLLIVALNSTDPAAAVARLKSLPEDQRADSLRRTGWNLKDEDQLAYANLIRNGLPEKAQTDYFKWQIDSGLREKVYSEITEYLDRIKATPAERAICVEEAAKSKIQQLSRNKKVTREDLDAMREWTTRQAPGTTDQVTGIVLAEATQKLDFSGAAALATQYNQAAGNDEVLIGFLMAYDPNNGSKEEARVLAQKISDVEKREQILSRFK